jgi:DNA-binding transcriptional MerR regulator
VDDGLPDKEFFRIGEVAKLVGVKPYVLRFWEGEFKREIRPERTRSNQRMYRRRDVETFLRIKRLRYEEKLELSGARRKLRDDGKAAVGSPGAETLRRGLEELLRIVDEDEAGE